MSRVCGVRAAGGLDLVSRASAPRTAPGKSQARQIPSSALGRRRATARPTPQSLCTLPPSPTCAAPYQSPRRRVRIGAVPRASRALSRAFPSVAAGRRRPSVFLVRPPEAVNVFFFFFGAACPRAPAGHQRTERRRPPRPPSSRLPERAARARRAEHLTRRRRPARAQPPIPLTHALERGMLHGERGVARRRQRARVALRLGRFRHAHITTQESHTHSSIPDGVVGDVRRPHGAEPDLRAVILAEVDVARAIPRSEQRREIHEQSAVARRRARGRRARGPGRSPRSPTLPSGRAPR